MTSISNVEEILTQAATAAIDGEMDDTTRVSLYQLALTVASEELFRIEEMLGGTVNPGSLLLIQQLGLLASPDVDPSKLLANIQQTIKVVTHEEEPNSGEDEPPTSGV